MNTTNKINITTIGWGNGSYWLLSSIRDNDNYNISAIISMSDSGGSTWVLREEFGILPPGDVRRAVLALSREHDVIKQLFSYRFDKDSTISGHSLWNLMIAAMADLTWDFDKWLKQISKLLKVRWRVIPVTLWLSHLNVELENWDIIEWETKIDLELNENSSPIKRAYLIPEVEGNPRAIKAIEKSDVIILSFWDVYTSVIPNLLCKWIKEAIAKNKNAKIVYFVNLMTKPGETTDFEVIRFIDTIENYLWKDILTHIIVNNWFINEKLAQKYKSLEKKKPVKIKNLKHFEWKSYEIIETDLLHENDWVRHSFDKIAGIIEKIVKK